MNSGDIMTTPARHLFVIDPVGQLNLAWDTTIKLTFAMSAAGAEVFCTTLAGLVQNSHPTRISAHCQRMSFSGSPETLNLTPPTQMSFDDFDCVHMRKEPPYDLAYIECLWILNQGKAQTRVINDPTALQQINEKLVILDFPQYCRPAIVSSDPQALFEFAKSHCGGDIVVKPLNLYGGRGVVRLHEPSTLLADLKRETQGGSQTRLVQRYEPKVTHGEVRAFAVGGRPMSWCLKVPSPGDFLANTRAGSTLHEYTPTAREEQIVSDVASELMTRGVYVTGFDLIDGWLSEVNITCPALLAPDRKSLKGFDDMAKRLIHSS